MRITDRFKYDLFMHQFNNVRGTLDRVQEQIASQRKVNRPSDDPVAFSTYVSLNSENLLYEQLDRNIQRVTTFGRVYETCFNTMGDLLADAKEVAINHASGSMDSALRDTAVTQVESIIEQLVTLGNTVVGDTYVFGGKQSTSAPFRLNPDYSVDFLVAEGSEAANKVYVDRGSTAQYNISGKEAFYDRLKTLYANPANAYTGEVSLNATDLAFVVDATNNTISRNSDPTAITLTQGVYTGAELASEIQARLNDTVLPGEAGYVVAFDASTRKFTIANNTANEVTLDWSVSTNAGSLLGFNAVDSRLEENGGRDTSDLDTGAASFAVRMLGGDSYEYSVNGGIFSGSVDINSGTYIDGSLQANATNRGIMITFSSTNTSLAAGDTFEIKDYSIFETLKNLRDALQHDNSTWSSDNISQISEAVDIVNKNIASVGVNLQTMNTLTEANDARQQRTSEIISETINADLAQLAVEYNSLSTVYQSLMYSVVKMQELGLLNYLS
jgi:flagellin-like hook-associated protein FlgL